MISSLTIPLFSTGITHDYAFTKGIFLPDKFSRAGY